MKHRRLNESDYSEIAKNISAILKKCGVKPFNVQCYYDDGGVVYKCYDAGVKSLGTIELTEDDNKLFIGVSRDGFVDIVHEIELCNKQIKIAESIRSYENALVSLLSNNPPEIEDVSKREDEDAVYFIIFGKYQGSSFEVQYNTFDREFVFDKLTKKSFSDNGLDEIENTCHLYLTKNFKEYR